MSEDNNKQLYKVSVEGAGVSMKKEVPHDTAFEIIAIMMGKAPAAGGSASHSPIHNLGPGALAAGGNPPARQSNGRPTQSLREVLNSASATKNPEKIVTIGAYLQDLGADQFTREEVKAKFKSAGESLPGNYPRDFTLTVSTGWLAEDDSNPGSYYVTQSGRAAIGNGFADAKIKNRKPRRKSRNKGDE